MTDKVLVIGATGSIGRTLVKNLSRYGYPVRAATRIPIPYAVSHPDLDVVLFDYEDPQTYSSAVTGVSKAFIIPKTADPEPQKTVIPLIDHARSAGVSHIVLVTSLGVAQPANKGLLAVEDYLIASGAMYTILRPNWYMQNFNLGFILPAIQKTGTIFLPADKAKISFVDTRDVAAVATIALTEEGHLDRTYTLTGSEALTYEEAAVVLSQFGGRLIRYVPTSDREFKQLLLAGGWQEEQVKLMAGLFEGVRQGIGSEITSDIKTLLGRDPIRLVDFASEYADAWRFSV